MTQASYISFPASPQNGTVAPVRIKRDQDDNAARVPIYWPAGFHGDPYLMELVDTLVQRVSQFVETGTDSGSTVGYVARMYPHIACWSCEASKQVWEIASKNLECHPNVHLENLLSASLLGRIPYTEHALFWLDAHSHGWGGKLDEERALILDRWPGGYIFMDDFQVPGRPELGFDWYESDGPVNWDNMGKAVKSHPKLKALYYPKYPPPHGTRGFGLLVFGDASIEGLPEFLVEAK